MMLMGWRVIHWLFWYPRGLPGSLDYRSFRLNQSPREGYCISDCGGISNSFFITDWNENEKLMILPHCRVIV